MKIKKGDLVKKSLIPNSMWETDLDGAHLEKFRALSPKNQVYKMLKVGGFIPEEFLKNEGFKEINGEWVHKSDI